MGIDPVHIINHKLAYKKPEEFVSKLKAATGFDVFVGRIAVSENVEEIRLNLALVFRRMTSVN